MFYEIHLSALDTGRSVVLIVVLDKNIIYIDSMYVILSLSTQARVVDVEQSAFGPTRVTRYAGNLRK